MLNRFSLIRDGESYFLSSFFFEIKFLKHPCLKNNQALRNSFFFQPLQIFFFLDKIKSKMLDCSPVSVIQTTFTFSFILTRAIYHSRHFKVFGFRQKVKWTRGGEEMVWINSKMSVLSHHQSSFSFSFYFSFFS